jgi:hypothetical protein
VAEAFLKDYIFEDVNSAEPSFFHSNNTNACRMYRGFKIAGST